jgi:nitroreductase
MDVVIGLSYLEIAHTGDASRFDFMANRPTRAQLQRQYGGHPPRDRGAVATDSRKSPDHLLSWEYPLWTGPEASGDVVSPTRKPDGVGTESPDTGLHPLLAQRRSPRAYDPSHWLDDMTLTRMLEAARSSPSDRNSQPWRFIVGRRAEPVFERLLACLAEGNRRWARFCSALICGLVLSRDDDGTALPWAQYDLGQAIAYLTVQAQADGIHVRQMAGFDALAIRRAFRVPADLRPFIVVAAGARGDTSHLPERWRTEERATRVRSELRQLVQMSGSETVPW